MADKNLDSILQTRGDKDFAELLKMSGRDSFFLFDTETTGKEDDQNAQIWQIGGVLIERHGESISTRKVEYFIKPNQYIQDIVDGKLDDQNMFFADREVSIREFFGNPVGETFYGLYADSNAEMIAEEELFEKIPCFRSGSDTLYSAFNIKFDKTIINKAATRAGARGIKDEDSVDMMLFLHQVMPLIQRNSIDDLENNEELVEILKANHIYSEKEVARYAGIKNKTIQGYVKKATTEFHMDPSTARDFATRQIQKYSIGKYNLEKVRSIFSNPVWFKKALLNSADALGIHLTSQQINRCSNEVQRISKAYNLSAREAHTAFEDTIQMIGVGAALIEVNKLFGVITSEGLAPLTNMLIGSAAGQYDINKTYKNQKDKNVEAIQKLEKKDHLIDATKIEGYRVNTSGRYDDNMKKIVDLYKKAILSHDFATMWRIEQQIKKLDRSDRKNTVIKIFSKYLDGQTLHQITDKEISQEIYKYLGSKKANETLTHVHAHTTSKETLEEGEKKAKMDAIFDTVKKIKGMTAKQSTDYDRTHLYDLSYNGKPLQLEIINEKGVKISSGGDGKLVFNSDGSIQSFLIKSDFLNNGKPQSFFLPDETGRHPFHIYLG